MPLRLPKLRFDDEGLERVFRTEFTRRDYNAARILLVVVALGFGGAAAVVPMTVFAAAAPVFASICLACFGGAAVLWRKALPPSVSNFTTSAFSFLFCVGYEEVLIRSAPSFSYLAEHQPNIQFLVVFCFMTATRALLPFKVMTGSAIFASLFLQHYLHFGPHPQELAEIAFSGLLSVAIGSTIAYRIERLERDNFLRIRKIREDNQQTEDILRDLLPGRIFDRYQQGEATIQDLHERVAVMFCRLDAGYDATMASEVQLEAMSAIYAEFDDIAKSLDLEKIKTVGPVYMATAGLFRHDGTEFERIVQAANRMHEVTRRFHATLAVGIDQGAVASGVIGTSTVAFDVWGAPVNRASRLAGLAETGCTLVPADVLPARVPGNASKPLGKVSLRGIGDVEVRALRKEAA